MYCNFIQIIKTMNLHNLRNNYFACFVALLNKKSPVKITGLFRYNLLVMVLGCLFFVALQVESVICPYSQPVEEEVDS